MNDLDAVLDQFAVDVPDPPTVADLRSRVQHRHRRPASAVAVLAAALLIAAGLVTTLGSDGSNQLSSNQEPTVSAPQDPTVSIPQDPSVRYRNYEIVVTGVDTSAVDVRQTLALTGNWVPEDGSIILSAVTLTSRSEDFMRVKVPTFSHLRDGRPVAGNRRCGGPVVCSERRPVVDLLPDEESSIETIFVDIFALPLGSTTYTANLRYEVAETGETGVIPITVSIDVEESIPGDTPGQPEPPSTFTLPPAPPTS